MNYTCTFVSFSLYLPLGVVRRALASWRSIKVYLVFDRNYASTTKLIGTLDTLRSCFRRLACRCVLTRSVILLR